MYIKLQFVLLIFNYWRGLTADAADLKDASRTIGLDVLCGPGGLGGGRARVRKTQQNGSSK